MDFHFDLNFTEESSSLPSTISLLFFSFTFIFSIFSLSLYILRLRPWCNCDLCRSYLSSAWSESFPNLSDWYADLLRRSPSATIHLHVLSNLVTANPDNVEHILSSNFQNYPKGQPFSSLLGDLLGHGIFNVDGDTWRFQRKMASLELGSVAVRSHAFEIVWAQIRTRLIPVMSAAAMATAVDLQDVFRRFSFDVICRFSFGVDPGCLRLSMPVSEFAVAFDVASRVSAERAMGTWPVMWRIKRALNLGSERRLKEAIKIVNGLAEEVIRHRRQIGFSGRNDLLSRFMASTHDDRYLRDIVVSFLLAGRDTVASALTSFFWLLAQHPEVEAKILSESDRVMGPDRDAAASFENLRDMHYLHAAVYENMRLFPPVQFDSKFAVDDDVLPDGTFVHKGTRVTYHPYAMGRMDRIWGPDCLRFNPDRWLNNGCFSPENPFKFPVFQAGLRVCLGKELAVMDIKSVAVALVRKFQIRLDKPDRVARFAPGLTASWRGGLPVRIQERTPN
ncbi:cytochrome P450 94C1 [Momordica charantia]|uniref:Cytochrome P450 94C1 n=1 Tax=Momordica charantia TaxID=3673 RepID=A0A6J1CMZ9_MOMCH|nr:cytochrome P450 94C1 [Momordica charantia]